MSAYVAIHYCKKEKTYYIRDDQSNQFRKVKYKPTYYKLDPEGLDTDLFGRCVTATSHFDKENKNLLQRDIDKELLYLRDKYYHNDDIPKKHNIIHLDIEIEILGTLTSKYIKEAIAKITSLALMDSSTKKKYCYILDENKVLSNLTQNGTIIKRFDNESDLLESYLELWGELDPTIMVGYNSAFFDLPYLYYRIKNVLGESAAKKLSPIRKILVNENQEDDPIKIGGINHLDMYHLIKKYIAKEEPSYKLGDIGLKYAKLGKIEYKGSLDDLFKVDPAKFIEYNIRDVEILDKLEEVLQFIKLTIIISHLCHTPYDQIYYNTVLNEGAILTYLKRKNIIPPNKPTTVNPSIHYLEIGDTVKLGKLEKGIIVKIEGEEAYVESKSRHVEKFYTKSLRKIESYAGGYLLPIIPGLYYDVMDLDFTSLYPSIIKSLNLGIETLVGRIVTKDNFEKNNTLQDLLKRNPEEIVKIQKLNINSYSLEDASITLKDLIDYIISNNLSISASGTFFKNDKKSIACEILEDWFIQREYYRDLKKKAGKEGDWVKYTLYDMFQQAFKILQNSLYGTYAINGWRFTDGHKICSAAITNSGQILTISAGQWCNDEGNKLMDMNKQELIAYFEL